MRTLRHPPRLFASELALVFATLIWGTTLVAVKEAVAILPPFTFIALRFTLGAATLALPGFPRLRSLNWPAAAAGCLAGLFLFAGFALQTLGLQLTSASSAAFITGLCVVLVPVASYFWLRQRTSARVAVGVVLATIGLALLSLRDGLSLGRGDVLVLLCAVAFALHIVAIGRYAPRIDALALTFVQLAFVALAGWLIALATEPLPLFTLRDLSSQAILLVLFMGIVATALVFAIQNLAQRNVSPTRAAVIFTLEPVLAALFASFWLAEQLDGRALLGAALIVSGMLAAALWRDSSRNASCGERMEAGQGKFIPSPRGRGEA